MSYTPPKPGVKVPREGRNKYLTGHCGTGHCEGTKLKSPAGVFYPTCKDLNTCPCKCHADLDEIYSLLGKERKLILSEYVPDYGNFVSIDVIRDAAFEEHLKTVALSEKETSNEEVTVAAGHVFETTLTGRKARGQLEYEVLEICQWWQKGIYDWQHCSPKLLAEEVGNRKISDPPSTGAIDAILKRWDRIGFIELGKKPVRIVRFKTNSSERTLDRLKSESRRKRARYKSDLKRGYRAS